MVARGEKVRIPWKVLAWKLYIISSNGILRRSIYLKVPSTIALNLVGKDHLARNRSIGQNKSCLFLGETSIDPTVDSGWPSEGLKLNIERNHHLKRKKMAFDDRSARSGQQVHQNFRKIIPYVGNRCCEGKIRHAFDEDLVTGHSERKVVFAGECRERARSSPVADLASTDSQNFRVIEHLFRRQDTRLQ